jgi:hypothetical protein
LDDFFFYFGYFQPFEAIGAHEIIATFYFPGRFFLRKNHGELTDGRLPFLQKFIHTRFSCTASHSSTTNQILVLHTLNRYSSLDADKSEPVDFASGLEATNFAPQSNDAKFLLRIL